MKNFKNYFCYLAILALVFTSCSKEDPAGAVNSDGKKADLSLGPILNDLVNKSALKQAEDLPECSDTDPAFAAVSLTYETDGPDVDLDLVLQIAEDDNGYFTLYHDQLEIPIPTGETTVEVTLNEFMVYNNVPDVENPEAPGTLIWIAPMEESDYENFVGDALPIIWDLRAGTKNYMDVEVVCFDDRVVNRYGYQFFDIVQTPLIEFCLFGNYCPPSGRHYPAAYSVDVWNWSEGEMGDQIYFDEISEVTPEDGEYFADPLCFALPDREGQDEYYFEISLIDVENQYDGPNQVILQGVITDDEIRNFYNGDNLEYYHFQYGCDGDIPPPFFDPEDDAEHYKACLYPQGETMTLGFAYFSLKGNVLETEIRAIFLEDGPHLQHIHENADCDEPGPSILSLTEEDGSWPITIDGDLNYSRTFTLSPEELVELGSLENRTINLHGVTEDGEFNVGKVISCGEISAMN